jgi:hypothetical protein
LRSQRGPSSSSQSPWRNGNLARFPIPRTKGALVCYKTQPSETLHSAPGNAPLQVR